MHRALTYEPTCAQDTVIDLVIEKSCQPMPGLPGNRVLPARVLDELNPWLRHQRLHEMDRDIPSPSTTDTEMVAPRWICRAKSSVTAGIPGGAAAEPIREASKNGILAFWRKRAKRTDVLPVLPVSKMANFSADQVVT